MNDCGSQLGVRGLSPLLNGEMTLRAEAASPGLGPVEGPKGGVGAGQATAHPTGVPPSHLCPWREEEGPTPGKVDEFPNTSLDRGRRFRDLSFHSFLLYSPNIINICTSCVAETLALRATPPDQSEGSPPAAGWPRTQGCGSPPPPPCCPCSPHPLAGSWLCWGRSGSPGGPQGGCRGAP